MDTFGEIIKQFRIDSGFTLRRFCVETGYDPSNWSKIERGLLTPPKSQAEIKRIAAVLRLDIEKIHQLLDLAILQSIPKELADEEILGKLPVFFRTIRGNKPTKKEIEELVRILRTE